MWGVGGGLGSKLPHFRFLLFLLPIDEENGHASIKCLMGK